MMKIVILDGYTVNPGDNPWGDLARLGELVAYDRTPPDKIIERGGDADIILTNKTPLHTDILDRLPRLRFIAELATGYDNIDIAAAGRLGIPVANVPEYSTDSVAQHTIALLLALCNRVAEHADAVNQGEWCSSPDFSFCKAPLVELAGKKFGIIGFGHIGQRVGGIAHALGMEILAFNPHHRNRTALFSVAWLDLCEVFSSADVVSLHCPLTTDNEGFVNAELIGSMKRSAFLINTARGKLINEADLASALGSDMIAGAALDVVSREPIFSDNPLLHTRNCLITPHIGWASLEARRRLTATTIRNIEAFLDGQQANIVNASYLCSG
jgi:glycerate dehydrogenase